MQNSKRSFLGIIIVVIGISLIIFSLMIKQIAGASVLSRGMYQAIEFALGSLALLIGIFFIVFPADSIKSIFAKVLTTVISFAFSLVLLEILLRILIPQPKFDTRLPLYPFVNQQIEVDLQGVAPLIHHSTNSWGFRGDEPPINWSDYYSIVTIGGSTTQSYYINDDLTWPALLQSNLRQNNDSIWVGNAGLDGHSTRGHLLLMNQVIREIHPDMLIFLVGINDLGVSLSSDPSIYGTSFDRQEAPLLFQSQLFRLAWQLKGIVFDKLTTTRSAHRNYEPVRINIEELSPVPQDLHELLPTLPAYRDNLNQLIDIAEELGMEVLFLTQPLLFDDTDEWQNIEGNTAWIREQNITISAATYWNLLEIYNETLLEVCEERDVHCYDLGSQIPHSNEYFYDIVHFNEAGSALVAELVSVVVEEILQANS